MKKVMMIANLRAGKGKATLVRRQIRQSFWGWPYEIHFSKSCEDARATIKRLSPETHEAIFLFGGDGTIHQMLPALVDAKIPVVTMPFGTANDLASELGISNDWNQVQGLLDEKRIEAIDLIDVNGHLFATVGGTGVGAQLTLQYNRLRQKSPLVNWLGRKLKSQVYTLLSIENIVFHQHYNHSLRISSDSFNGNVTCSCLFVCNQSRLGGDLWIAPQARNFDGQFDVMILPHTKPVDILKALADVKLGRPPAGAIEFSTRKLIVEDLDKRPIPVFGDGEQILESSILEFKIQPKRLLVYRTGAPAGVMP